MLLHVCGGSRLELHVCEQAGAWMVVRHACEQGVGWLLGGLKHTGACSPHSCPLSSLPHRSPSVPRPHANRLRAPQIRLDGFFFAYDRLRHRHITRAQFLRALNVSMNSSILLSREEELALFAKYSKVVDSQPLMNYQRFCDACTKIQRGLEKAPQVRGGEGSGGRGKPRVFIFVESIFCDIVKGTQNFYAGLRG